MDDCDGCDVSVDDGVDDFDKDARMASPFRGWLLQDRMIMASPLKCSLLLGVMVKVKQVEAHPIETWTLPW